MSTHSDALEAPGTEHSRVDRAQRNLVVCCDGTGNEIGVKLSNVLKLYRVAEKNDTQLVYYDPGIGTIDTPSPWGRLRQNARALFGMATGWGLDRNVLDAYCFLCRNYRDGDRIFLFGFSRGGYSVRVLAGLIQLVGLLRPHQVNFAGYAMVAYKRASTADDYEVAHSFRRTALGRYVPIHFIGVWDSVASVIVPGRGPLADPVLEELPFTRRNPSVAVFRQALAMDEFRRMFRPLLWEEPQVFMPNPHKPKSSEQPQDIRQLWFAGCHSDIGGGYPEAESALAKIPLIWMLEEAEAHGLATDTAMVNHIARGLPRKNARVYTKPDPTKPLHRSLTLAWRPLEYFPKSAKLREWPQRRVLAGLYLPRGEPRAIPEGALIHQSVAERRSLIAGYQPINLPA